jgi:LmbE family N-acetylglucosaminyl deacetylase
MCILAHPDDESLGTGGALAKYGRDGVETYLITATRGERGRFGESGESPGPEIVGRTRETELLAAAKELGLREVKLLNYEDGALDRADRSEALETIVGHLRRVRPQVVITFGPEGAYGHPDHIAICQLTTAAVVRAADKEFAVSKLYYIAWPEKKWAAYQAALKNLTARVDGVDRKVTPWPDWAITTVIDTSDVWPTVWRAVNCHRTQMSIYKRLEGLSDEYHRSIWGSQEFYRAFSLVNGGRTRESDLFEGLRGIHESRK